MKAEPMESYMIISREKKQLEDGILVSHTPKRGWFDLKSSIRTKHEQNQTIELKNGKEDSIGIDQIINKRGTIIASV